ncbi:hypothetical protein AB1Y20_017903 [Prymnesium parvum]
MMPSAWHPAYTSGIRSHPMNSSFCPGTRSPRTLHQSRPATHAMPSATPQHRALSRGKDPQLTLVHGNDHSYRAVLELPSSSHAHRTLEDVSAHVNKAAGILAVHGVVVSTPRVQEFVVRRRSALFATPARARVAGMAPAGAYVVGSRCEENPDWVELEDGYLPLSVLQPVDGSQPTAHRFVKEVTLPDDANLELATVSSPNDGAVFEVRVPRKRLVPSAMKKVQPARMKEPKDATKMHSESPLEPKPEGKDSTKRNSTPQPAPTAEVKGATKQKPAAQPAREDEDDQPRTKRRVQRTSEELLCKAAPVLYECEANKENIQMPMDCTEEWQAMPSGGFSLLQKSL